MKRNLTTVKESLSQSRVWRSAKPLLGNLIKWTVWAVLALNLAAAALYAIGSYRKAADSAQLALVRFCLLASLLLVISCVYGVVLDLYYTVRKKKLSYLAGAAGYLAAAALGAFFALASAFIIGAVEGNR